MIVGVLVQLSNQSVDKIFDYQVPLDLQSKIKLGIRVQVPFGKQTLEGFVLEIKKNTAHKEELKQVQSIIDEEQVLNTELLELGKWLQEQTMSTLINCYQVMLPKALKAKIGTTISKKMDVDLTLNISSEDVANGKWNSSQQRVLEQFQSSAKVKKQDLLKISSSSTKWLLEKGILKEEQTEHYRYHHEFLEKEQYPLTEEQQQVVNQVLAKKNESATFLLFGVTGSGKTECYMELIENAMKEGKSSIVLVPEISLTPQMVERFESRFKNNVAVLHSRLSDGEKYDEWRKIARGEVKIVIGARSAIFAPLTNIGMIIIDEEHSSTYKQENEPKYNAIDVAKQRSITHHCPVVLGSATPTLESFARAQKGRYQLLQLPHRVNQKPLPKVTIVDMSAEIRKGHALFSRTLQEKIQDRLDKGEQIMLLLNRRGYASFVTCQNCGHVEKCPNCDITLTYHKSSNTMRCHYCGYGTKKITKCPKCGEEAIQELGNGTEKVEEELQKHFPNSRILRMDFDTTSRKGSHEKMIRSFENHEYDILLGTQMIAKGLDFANVTLVGVINADTSLNIPDFRSSEMTFQLLNQVSGRSGRKEKEGEVIIQTFNQDHYAIHYAKQHDYLGFYHQEMKIRKELKYPPFYYLTYVKICGKDYETCKETATKVGSYLKSQLQNSIVLGPSVCSVFRVNNVYRFGIIIKYKQEPALYPVLSKLKAHYQSRRDLYVDIDFNPNHI